jgi:hypothetical protein
VVDIRSDLIARVCIITAVFSIISYLVMQRNIDSPAARMIMGPSAIPLLFVLFGAVVLISILYDLKRYHVMNPKR